MSKLKAKATIYHRAPAKEVSGKPPELGKETVIKAGDVFDPAAIEMSDDEAKRLVKIGHAVDPAEELKAAGVEVKPEEGQAKTIAPAAAQKT